MDSQAQYTVTSGGVADHRVVDQDQVPATISVTGLTYNNTTGLVTAAANNALVNNNSLVAGSIVHISGASPSQYDGTFVVQGASATSFTYALASGLNLSAATGTITAGLNDVWISLGTYTMSGAVSVQLVRTTNAKASEWTIAGGMELVAGQQTTALAAPTFGNINPVPTPPATLAPGQYAVIVSNYAAFEERYNPTGTSNILVLGVYSSHLSNGGDTVDIYQIGASESGSVTAAERLRALLPSRPHQLQQRGPLADPARRRRPGPDPHQHGQLRQRRRSTGRRATPAARPARPTSPSTPRRPSVPANLTGQAVLSPTAEISLTWSASSDSAKLRGLLRHLSQWYPTGHVDDQPLYADTTAVAGTNYTYTVSAVNRDGYPAPDPRASAAECLRSSPAASPRRRRSCSTSASR